MPANAMQPPNTPLDLVTRDFHGPGRLVGTSAPMQRVYEQICSAASNDATVIIYGEPGTGKELVARAIHGMSARNREPFVPVHCGAIPENLIESEFFGYAKGAFSGANEDKAGYVDAANHGTLFMDEIGEISPHMQVKLLRVIDGGGYTPLGTTQIKFVNMRIIAATNRDMQERIDQKKIRRDFFYRIHILPIHLPPLRQRKTDLPLLIDYFISRYGANAPPLPITKRQTEALMAYHWPGNVRELQNVILRYCHIGKIQLMETPAEPFETPWQTNTEGLNPTAGALRSRMCAYEKSVIEQALNTNGWNRGKVAKLLGVDRKTLFTKMKRHGLI